MSNTRESESEHIGCFPIGRIEVTAALAQTVLRRKLNLIPPLLRHVEGDWGDVARIDRRKNDEAALNGCDLYSLYVVEPDVRVFIITYADRGATALMLAHEVVQV